jgi:hypothetical protein
VRRMSFDWRWAGLIAVIIILAGANRGVPPLFVALALAAGAFFLLRHGWRVWGGRGAGGRARVTYWRGQRIELSEPRGPALPPLRSIGPAALYLLLGAILALGALTVALRSLGIVI